MNKPVLVVMAAGMGSRYGGMKQIDPVGPNRQVIMDYSLYDARRAGSCGVRAFPRSPAQKRTLRRAEPCGGSVRPVLCRSSKI